jgi:uncharacterized circularly permuted ATP-grasp superfamily protein
VKWNDKAGVRKGLVPREMSAQAVEDLFRNVKEQDLTAYIDRLREVLATAERVKRQQTAFVQTCHQMT